MIVYLAGGIHGLSDAECVDWREHAARELGLHGLGIRNPMMRDYRGREDENVNTIVESDLRDIVESDVVLAMCPRPSWGAAMEIHYAHSIGKRVFAVVPSGSVSPWLRYHAVICTSLDEAIERILAL